MGKKISIGIVSDTHGWVHPFLAEAFEGVECILHAGDIGREEVIEELEEIAPVHAVKGNIDGGDLRFYPEEVVKEIGGKRIGIRHICGSPKSPNKATRAFIKREKLDLLIVGHSHIPVVGRVLGTLWLNPGAAGKSGHHDLRFAARLHITDGEIEMDRIHLGERWKIPDESKGEENK